MQGRVVESSDPAQSTSPLLIQQDGGLIVLTLDRPAARNSLSAAMLDALRSAIDIVSDDSKVRAVVLAGRGPAFCAGHDLKEMTARRSDHDGGRAFYQDMMERCSGVMQSIMKSPKPFIAAVQGTATAAGCQLVATCDLAIAAETARFCTPGVDIGLFCSTPMVALARNVPRKRAMEMLLLGDTIDAPSAAAYGLVNRVVPADRLMPEALHLAHRIADKPARTVAIGKAAFYAQIEQPVAEAYTYAADVMVRNMMTDDAVEGIGAFLEKRTPVWKGCG
ncbi:MAG: enoyl-CoA hydratase [Hyphomicrobiaceae bacterium]